MDDNALHDLVAMVQWDSSRDYPGGDLANATDWLAERKLICEIEESGNRFVLCSIVVPDRELFGLTLDDCLYFTDGGLMWRVPWRLLEQQDVNTLRLLPRGEA